MSEALSENVGANDSRASQSKIGATYVGSLKQGSLGLLEMIGSTLANIGPTIEVLFVIGAIGAVVGLGAPFLILIAMIGFLFHLNTTATFSKIRPHAGSYTSFMKMTWGGGAGGFSTVLFLGGYYFGLLSAVALLVAFWFQATIQDYFSATIPWPVLMLVLVIGCALLNIRGIQISTRVAVAFFLFEALVVVVSLVVMAIQSGQYLTWRAFEPASLHGGFGGIGIAFPLAIFMIIGASNTAALGEEVKRPRVNIPIAIYGAAILAMLLFVFASISVDAAFHNNAVLLSKPSLPVIAASGIKGTFLVRLIYLAGCTSVLAILIAGINSGNRIVYSLGREGFLPKFFAHTNRWHVPARSIYIGIPIALAIAGVTGWLLGGPQPGFSELSSAGTVLYVILLIVVNCALIAYTEIQRRHEGLRLSGLGIFGRYLAPLVGSVILAYPLWESIKPGAAGPSGWTWLVCAIGLVTGIIAWIALQRSKRGVNSKAIFEVLVEEVEVAK